MSRNDTGAGTAPIRIAPRNSVGERERVVEDHQHPVLAPHAELLQHAAGLADARVQLRVRQLLAGAADGDLAAAAGLEVAVDERPRVHGRLRLTTTDLDSW